MSVAAVIRRVAAALVVAVAIVPAGWAQDTTPPDLVDFSFTPTTIDVSSGPQDVTVTLRVTDDLSGVHGMTFVGPSGVGLGVSLFANHRISGDEFDGVYEGTITFPQFSAAGTWSVNDIFLVDEINNNHTVILDPLGFPTDLEIVLADIDVSPAVIEFGDVDLGLSPSQAATITNLGDANLVVNEIDFNGTAGDFSISSAPTLPGTLLPDETVDVEITFAPTVLGEASAILQITSNDPDQPAVEVLLTGEGVTLDPSDTLGTILEFFDQSVMDGTLVGSGPGGSGPGRLGALRNMLEAAGDLLDAGLTEDACNQLLDALLRTDGVFPPPDFVEGTAAPELATQIQALRESLGCEVVCGDVNRGGDLGPEDTDRARDYLVRLTPEPPFELVRCSVSGEERSCTVADVARMRRWTNGLPVTLQNGCLTAILDPGSP